MTKFLSFCETGIAWDMNWQIDRNAKILNSCSLCAGNDKIDAKWKPYDCKSKTNAENVYTYKCKVISSSDIKCRLNPFQRWICGGFAIWISLGFVVFARFACIWFVSQDECAHNFIWYWCFSPCYILFMEIFWQICWTVSEDNGRSSLKCQKMCADVRIHAVVLFSLHPLFELNIIARWYFIAWLFRFIRDDKIISMDYGTPHEQHPRKFSTDGSMECCIDHHTEQGNVPLSSHQMQSEIGIHKCVHSEENHFEVGEMVSHKSAALNWISYEYLMNIDYIM